MDHPYKDLPERAFWSPAVGRRDALDIDNLWVPKFAIAPRHQIATFGSCFAQHFGRALAVRGYNWMATEAPPAQMSEERAKELNFGVFTARTGNIYTVSLLHQWVRWALGEKSPQDEIWEKDGRFYDPFRPIVEPNGFESHEEMLASRDMTIEAVGRSISESQIFVFTLGLTESWWNIEGGYEYPMCPGTVAGDFDSAKHAFKNSGYKFIAKELQAAIKAIRTVNPNIKILLTVSPVPLTATMSGNHVLVATNWSKSVLRAVAGQFAEGAPRVDYFPSYEIISSTPFEGRFYAENKRGVQSEGVAHVMSQFFAGLDKAYPQHIEVAAQRAKRRAIKSKNATNPQGSVKKPAPVRARSNSSKTQEDLVCEEELLAAFAPKNKV